MIAIKEKEPEQPFAPIPVSGSFSSMPILDLVVCPACGSGLTLEDQPTSGAFRCVDCAAEYPRIEMPNGALVPWLFAHPEAAFAEWSDRSARLMADIRVELESHNAAQNAGGSHLTQARIERHGTALSQYAEQLENLLKPYAFERRACVNPDRQKLSKSQTITSYLSNVFRDWVWGTEEVHLAAGVVNRMIEEASIDELGTMLTLGAGPGALPFLLERSQRVARSIKFDINPLSARIHTAMQGGERVDLYEFPFAPVDSASTAMLRRCAATNLVEEVGDAPVEESYVLGDISNLPFGTGVFDTVLTPWLLDILPEPVDQWLASINRLLRQGGVWIYTGSMNFESEQPAHRLSPEEFFELAHNMGFTVQSQDYSTLSYLQSPVSAHSRREWVVSFVATKSSDCSQPSGKQTDYTAPVVASDRLQYACSNYMLRAQVLGAVNGKRSMMQIAAAIAQHYDLDENVALQTVAQILEQHHG